MQLEFFSETFRIPDAVSSRSRGPRKPTCFTTATPTWLTFTEVSALQHEVLDDAVEHRPFVVEGFLGRLPHPLLSCHQG